MKILSPRVHGYLDYAVVTIFALAPLLFGFHGTPRILCWALAAVHLGMTLMTAFPMGIVKLIPFKVHGAAELGISVALVAMPFAFGFSGLDAARNFFIASGVGIFGVWLTTNYRATSKDRPYEGVRYEDGTHWRNT